MFTGKERYTETGRDYFGARYLSGLMWRFTSPDVPLLDHHTGDPQSWNLYSYVRSNPLIFTDPTGNDCVYGNGGGTGIDSVDSQSNSEDCGKPDGYWVDGTVTNARFAHGSLILTGTTNGDNGTSVSYGLGLDPGLLALQRGTRAAEPVVNTLAADTLGIVAGTGIVGAAPVAAATPAFIPRILNFAGKQAARAALQGMGLPAAQTVAAISAVARATSPSSIQILRQGQVQVGRIARARANGYQVIESIIDQAGGKQVVQKAFDAAKTLAHYDPKS